MKLTTILFDLDGTLLPMDQDLFLTEYFKQLAAYMARFGYEPREFVHAVQRSTLAMLKNDGGASNESRFWDAFAALYEGKRDVRADFDRFDAFYREKFPSLRAFCSPTPEAERLVSELKKRSFTVALATNPVFPAVATEARLRWAGFAPEDFAHYTTYENATCAKPSPEYYREIADTLGVCPEECLMVGNDVEDDLSAAKIGMKVFLLTDCLINRGNADLSAFPRGNFSALAEYIDQLL